MSPLVIHHLGRSRDLAPPVVLTLYESCEVIDAKGRGLHECFRQLGLNVWHRGNPSQLVAQLLEDIALGRGGRPNADPASNIEQGEVARALIKIGWHLSKDG